MLLISFQEDPFSDGVREAGDAGTPAAEVVTQDEVAPPAQEMVLPCSDLHRSWDLSMALKEEKVVFERVSLYAAVYFERYQTL